MNWFELFYYTATSGKTSAVALQSNNVKFLNPTTNVAYPVAQYEIGSQGNEYEVQVGIKTDVLIEWPSPWGTTLAAQTNTGWGYTVSNPDFVWLQ